MPGNWAGSDRRSRLPADWPSIRADVFARDGHRCTVLMTNDQRCPVTDGLECDHINRGDDHRMINLRTICAGHHQQKSSEEGRAAWAEKRARVSAKYRRSEPHPGSLG
jgi:5-methylcytosine-specific restriction protein A